MKNFRTYKLSEEINKHRIDEGSDETKNITKDWQHRNKGNIFISN